MTLFLIGYRLASPYLKKQKQLFSQNFHTRIPRSNAVYFSVDSGVHLGLAAILLKTIR